MSHKGTSRKYVGAAMVQRLAKRLQQQLRVTYATAVVKAKEILGVAP